MNLRKAAMSGLVALMLCGTGTAHAALIFDNRDAGDETVETRLGTFVFAAVVDVDATITINQIGVRFRPESDGDVAFLIFSSLLDAVGTGDLLFSQVVPVLGNPGGAIDYLLSGPLSFTLEAGQRYDIGILSNGPALTGTWDFTPNSGSGITSIPRNANFTDFAQPTTGNYSGVDPHIRLYATDVPEPGSVALLCVGLASLSWMWIRRRRGIAPRLAK